jgi:predicted aspartyl protease
MKMDAIEQEPRERVQKYFERLDKLFRKGKVQDVEQRRRFLAKLRPEIQKLCVVRVFADIEELVGATIEVERVLGELGETPFEPLKEEREEGMAKTSMENQVAVLNNTLINFFKGSVPNPVSSSSSTLFKECQICKGKDHIATTCPRPNEPWPKCAKCGMPHRTENCGVKCSFCSGLRHSEDMCWKMSKNGKSYFGSAKFLEVLLDDKEATLQQLNKLCGDENVFSHTGVPRRRLPIEVPPAGTAPSPEVAGDNTVVGRESSIRSKILSHFVKGKISLTPMETMMMIPGKLEQLENLVRVARRKKDAEVVSNQVSMVSKALTLMRRICINKTHKSKTLHLLIEINGYLIEGLVDTGASMSMMATAVVRELGMMHLVSGSETYKTALGVVTQVMGRIDEVSVKAGGVQCTMTYMVVDTDSYDVLFGLDFLIKIGAVVDVERGLIQVRKGPGTNVEVLPLTMVNLLHNVSSEALEHDVAVTSKSASLETLKVEFGKMSLYDSVANEQANISVSKSNTDADDDSEEGLQSAELIDEESEFGNTELDELVLKEGPHQILQLTLQDQVDDFMREEFSDSDDYADWLQWVSDAEEGKQISRKLTRCAEVPTMLQIHQVNVNETHSKQLALSSYYPKMSTRWEEISQKIQIDHHLGDEEKQQLWQMLGGYQDVFAWNKGELGCCTIGEHSIDMQGFPPCKASLGRLSYWEEAEVKRQIDALVDLGKMRPSNSEYAC